MPQKQRFCLLCKRHDRVSRSRYTSIYTAEREAKLCEGYRRRHRGEELPKPLLNQMVHKKCYNRTVQGVIAMPASTSVEPKDPLVVEEEDDGDVPEQVKQKSVDHPSVICVGFSAMSFSLVCVCPFR